MVETTKKMFEQVNEFLELYKEEIGLNDIRNMDDETFKALKLTLGIVKTYEELLIKEAEAMSKIETLERKIDSMDSKMIVLMKRTEE